MYMLVEIIDGTGVCVDDIKHVLWTSSGLHPIRSAGDQAFSVELVRVWEVSTYDPAFSGWFETSETIYMCDLEGKVWKLLLPEGDMLSS